MCYESRMVLIVGVHGIAQQYRGGAQLEQVWFPALRDGLALAGYTSSADKLSLTDLKVGFFGDLFRPRGALGGEMPPFSAKDLTSADEIELLTDLYDTTVALEPTLGPPHGGLGPARIVVQIMVERLLRSRVFANSVTERVLVGNLKQVTAFLKDDNVRAEVLTRIDQQVTTNTRVLIGHSLGSIVAYEYVCEFRPQGLQVLITLGSPLGIRNVVFDRLRPKPIEGAGVWPGSGDVESMGVPAWVNVADPNDTVALRKDLAPLFPVGGSGPGVIDVLVDNGKDPHGISPYLSAEETGLAIGQALEVR